MAEENQQQTGTETKTTPENQQKPTPGAVPAMQQANSITAASTQKQMPQQGGTTMPQQATQNLQQASQIQPAQQTVVQQSPQQAQQPIQSPQQTQQPIQQIQQQSGTIQQPVQQVPMQQPMAGQIPMQQITPPLLYQMPEKTKSTSILKTLFVPLIIAGIISGSSYYGYEYLQENNAQITITESKNSKTTQHIERKKTNSKNKTPKNTEAKTENTENKTPTKNSNSNITETPIKIPR